MIMTQQQTSDSPVPPFPLSDTGRVGITSTQGLGSGHGVFLCLRALLQRSLGYTIYILVNVILIFFFWCLDSDTLY